MTSLRESFTDEQRIDYRPKIVKRNTFQYTKGSDTVYRLHNTDIVTIKANGKIVLNSGGWKTITTKDRMNTYLPDNYCLHQDKGHWYIRDRMLGNEVPYYDGMMLPDCFNAKALAKASKHHKKEEKLRKDIKKFVMLITDDNRPWPHVGDCWPCSLRNAEGIPMGDTDNKHLLQHIKEGYIHGSLILNALTFSGYSSPQFIFQHGNSEILRRAVKKYLYRKLGLV